MTWGATISPKCRMALDRGSGDPNVAGVRRQRLLPSHQIQTCARSSPRSSRIALQRRFPSARQRTRREDATTRNENRTCL